MANRTWGRSLLVALGASLLAGAGQLGIAYGFGVLRFARSFGPVPDQWPAQLVWVGWFAAVAALVGAVLAERYARRDDLPVTPAVGVSVAAAALLGATVVAPLCMLPARDARVPSVDPVLSVAVAALFGALAGAVVAVAVLRYAPVRWNVAAFTGALWLLAVLSVAPSLGVADPLPDVRLGAVELTRLTPATAERWAMLILPGLALVVGAAVAGLARWLARPPLAGAASGAAGPLLVWVAYLVAGPGRGGDGHQSTLYWAALVAVGTGALGATATALLRWPLLARRGATSDAIEPTDILRPLPAFGGTPTSGTATSDSTATATFDANGTAAFDGIGTAASGQNVPSTVDPGLGPSTLDGSVGGSSVGGTSEGGSSVGGDGTTPSGTATGPDAETDLPAGATASGAARPPVFPVHFDWADPGPVTAAGPEPAGVPAPRAHPSAPDPAPAWDAFAAARRHEPAGPAATGDGRTPDATGTDPTLRRPFDLADAPVGPTDPAAPRTDPALDPTLRQADATVVPTDAAPLRRADVPEIPTEPTSRPPEADRPGLGTTHDRTTPEYADDVPGQRPTGGGLPWGLPRSTSDDPPRAGALDWPTPAGPGETVPTVSGELDWSMPRRGRHASDDPTGPTTTAGDPTGPTAGPGDPAGLTAAADDPTDRTSSAGDPADHTAGAGDPADRAEAGDTGSTDGADGAGASRGLRGLFRRNRSRSGPDGRGVPTDGRDQPPVPEHDEEYVDWVTGLSQPVPDPEPAPQRADRRTLRSGGRHQRPD